MKNVPSLVEWHAWTTELPNWLWRSLNYNNGCSLSTQKNVCFVFGSGFSSYLLILLFASSASSYLLIALKCMQVRVKSCSIKVCMSHRFCIDSSCFILFSVTCCQRSNNPSLLCSKACGPCEFLISCFGITLCRFSSNRHGLVRL